MSLSPPRPPRDHWQDFVDADNLPFFEHLLSMSEFQACSSFRDQCGLIFQLSPGLPLTQVGRFFGCATNSISNQRHALESPPGDNGRPPTFNAEQIAQICDYLTRRYNERCPARVCDLQNFCWEEFGIDVLPDTLRHLIRRLPFKTCEVKPIEDGRMRVTQQSIVDHFVNLGRAIEGVPSAMVINLDESGFQKYSDAHATIVIVPENQREQYYPVSRAEKRATFLAAVAADGACLKPLLVLPRKTIDAELLLAGYTPERVAFVHTSNGFINTDLFTAYVRNILIPYVNCARERLHYHGSPLD